MRKTITTVLVIVMATVLSAGVVYAATTRHVSSRLGGVAGDIFDIDGSLVADSITVGAQSVGGVTYFNGSIVNSTTGSGGSDNPVTFGDNVRIDGRVYRGATAGNTDAQPFIVNDNLEVLGNVTATDLSLSGNLTIGGTVTGEGKINSTHILDGSVATADLAADAVTSAKIADGTITGTDIASTAALSASSIALTGNATQSGTANGLLKGWVYADSAGTIISSYNVTSVTKTATGHYEVVFNFTVTDGSGHATRPYVAIPSGQGGAVAKRIIGAGPDATNANTVLVWTMDDAAAFADGVFMLSVF